MNVMQSFILILPKHDIFLNLTRLMVLLEFLESVRPLLTSQIRTKSDQNPLFLNVNSPEIMIH